MSILAPRMDLPLGRDEASRFLPRIVAVMVFLAVLALAGALAAHGAVERWRLSLAGTMTVQIPSPEGRDATEAAAEHARRVEAVRLVLTATPGIAAVQPLSRKGVVGLLEPWLGAGAVVEELPLPALIDVTLAPDAQLDTAELARRLAEAAPGAELDDHGRWLADVVTLGRAIQAAGIAIVGMVGFAAVAAVVFAVRSSLAVHRNVVEVLHMVGARDSYIARQFELHVLRLGLAGAAVGFVGAMVAIFGLAAAAGLVDRMLLPRLALGLADWLALALLPVLAALIAMVAARFAVLRALARMPSAAR